MFARTFGIICFLSISHFAAGFPKITHDKSQKPTIDFYGKRFTYNAAKEVRLNCSNGKKWDPIVIQEKNPVFPEASVKNVTSGKVPNVNLVVKYDEKHFVNLLKVTCSKGQFKREVVIEQHYPTANVKIVSSNSTVYEGEKVKLECIADGNPSPKYQWYNRTKTGTFEKVKNGGKSSIDITTPTNINSTSLYQCRASNDNKNWITSTSLMSVNSTVNPTPTIEAITRPLKAESTTTRFTYLETEIVSVRCSVPIPKNFILTTEHRLTKGNPVYKEETISVANKTDKQFIVMNVQYNPKRFVQEVIVFCSATHRTTGHKTTSNVTIVQQYKTNNVIIQELPIASVEEGDNVALNCTADGNPQAEYQWFNNSKPIAGAVKSTFEFKMLYGGIFICGAKNKHNNNLFSKSESVKVYVSPTIESITPTASNTSTKFTYLEAEKISLRCFLPTTTPADIKLKADVSVDMTIRNPFIYNNFTYTTAGNNHDLTIEILYDKEYFVPLINVTCKAINSSEKIVTTELSFSSVLIEQHYRTTAAFIKRPRQVDELEVKAGNVVSIRCIADGYPDPQEFQWFNNTESKMELISDENLFKFTTSDKWLSKGEYFCAAKNIYNEEFINSTVLPVTTCWLLPIIEAVTSPTNQTLDKFTYLETEKVTIRCRVPYSYPDANGLKAEVFKIETHSQFYSNFTYTVTGDFHNKTIDIFYWPKSFTPQVQLLCRDDFQDYSSVIIEQHFPISDVFIIKEGHLNVTDHVSTKAGDVVSMRCLANGYPKPTIQWFNNTNSKNEEIENATHVVYRLKTAAKYSSKGQYTCKAKNDHNLNVFEVSKPFTVTATYIPKPVIKPITNPLINNAITSRFTYNETSNVTLLCGLPPFSANIITLDVNAEIIRRDIKTYHSTEDGGNITLNIIYNEYNDDDVTVFCIAKIPTGQTETSSVTIEQYYGTTSVQILEYEQGRPDPKNVTLESGKKYKLQCTADGNPKPDYQWFNRSNSIDTPLVNGNQYEYWLTMPSKFSSEATYVCGAKNDFNSELKKSKPFTVYSVFLSHPKIESLSAVVKNTSNTFTYLDATTVSIRCFLPPGFPEDVEVHMNNMMTADGYAKLSQSHKGNKDVKLTIEYNLGDPIVPLISVYCYTTKPEWNYSEFSIVYIESHYTANKVNISGPLNGTTKPGDTVVLACSAFGNPPPKFQWYISNNNKVSEIANENKATIQFRLPSNRLTEEQYICGAKNEYNVDFVKSKPFAVSAIPPTPEPKKGGAATHYSNWCLLLSMTVILLLGNL